MASTSSLVSELSSTANKFESGVSTQSKKVHAALDKIDTTVNNVNKEIIALREMIIAGEEKQLAHENVIKIQKQINEELKTYQVVRRSVIGVIKDFDINLARNSTIQQLSEELWMSSSRYWLSYAFIGISAWVQDNKEICRNAVTEALRRDAVKASLFFCLLNLRFGRNAEAREWLYDYFGSVDSAHPPRETALLLQAYLYGVFGKDSQLDTFVQNTVDKWMSELNADTEISADLVKGYNDYVSHLPTEKRTFNSPVLDEYCANISQIEESLENASRYKSVLKRVDELDKVAEFNCGNDFIKSIDKLLDDLVTNYDESELKLRNEQKFYEMVMEHEGDVEAAKKEYAKFLENVKDAPNIGKQMFGWAVYPNGADESVQKFAMQKTKGWLEDAINVYHNNIRSSAPNAFKLKIDLWEDTIDGRDGEQVMHGLEAKFKAERSKLLIYTKPNIIMSAIAVIALILGCVIGMAATWIGYVAGAGLFVILALIVVITTVVKVKAFPKRIEAAKAALLQCLQAIEEYRTKYESMLAVHDDVLQKLKLL